MRKLYEGSDRVGEFFRATLAPSLRYAAEVAPSIAHSIDDVDRVMRWGYGWPFGPFELADAIGLEPKKYRTAPLQPAKPVDLSYACVTQEGDQNNVRTDCADAAEGYGISRF